MTGPTSPSSSRIPEDKFPRRMGCLGKVALVFVALVVAWFVWEGVAGAIHNARGREIERMGTEYVAVLNSYGPVVPASGERAVSRLSDLWDDDNDPTRRWTYGGGAEFAGDGSGYSPQEAYDGFVSYLLAHGWNRTQGTIQEGETYLSRGGFGITVSFHPNGDDWFNPNEVGFRITSPKAGGPRPA